MEEIPQTDLLLDPAWAAAHVARAFGGHFEVLREIRDYGRDLLKRLLATSVAALPDLVIVAGLLRQMVVSIDAYLLCAEGGAAQAAEVQLRSALESLMSLEFILLQDTEARARRLYIATVRRRLLSARMFIEGSREHASLDKAWRDGTGSPYELTAEKRSAGQENVANAEKALADDANRATNEEFEVEALRTGKEPRWYAIGDGAVRSIFALARAVKREAEYKVLYSPFSESSHGSDMDDHFKKEGDEGVAIQLIRDPARINDTIALAVVLPIRMYQMLLERYRPTEREVFEAGYLRRWRQYAKPIELNQTRVAG